MCLAWMEQFSVCEGRSYLARWLASPNVAIQRFVTEKMTRQNLSWQTAVISAT
jgi:hypothetical protein